MEKTPKLYVRTPLLILLAISLSCSGCTLSQKHPTSEQLVFQEEAESLQNGYIAYQSDDFEEAANTFAELYRSSRHDEIRRKALYGLACSKLFLAADVESRNAAIDLWQQWLRMIPDDMVENEDEDPRLMTPLLGRITPENRGTTTETINPETPGVSKGKDTSVDPMAASQLKTADLDDAGQPGAGAGSTPGQSITEAEYKNALEDKTKEIKQLKTALKKLKSEIHTLKEQIDSLETIHKMVQKKMKAIDTP